MGVASESPYIIVSTYDNSLHINKGNTMPSNPDVGQLWYDNNKISVWNGYGWIPVQDNTRTTIRLSPQIEIMIAKMLLNEAEEQQLKQDFPEIAEAHKAYMDLLASAKIVAKMRNSNLATTGS
jgi:hypothetical protein